MYCGDETGSFIGDVGSHSSRFGYGGNDAPVYHIPSYTSTTGERSVVVPSCLSKQWSERTVETPLRRPRMVGDTTAENVAATDMGMDRPLVDPTCYLQQGDSVENYASLEHIWKKAMEDMRVFDNFKHTKGADAAHHETIAASGLASSTIPSRAEFDGKCVHPILAVLPGCTFKVGSKDTAADNRKELIQLTELMMEKFDASAFFCAPTPMLAAFSHGRPNALVVDIGAGGTRVTPIVGGLVMKQAQRRTGRGGDWLSNVQWKAMMTQVDHNIRPHYQTRAKISQAKGIFHRWAMQECMYEFQTSGHVNIPNWWYDPTVPFIYSDEDAMEIDASPSALPSSETSYVLPDGQVIDLSSRVGKDLCRLPELYFSDQLPYLSDHTSSSADDTSVLDQHHSLSNLSLPRLIHASLSAVGDVDTRRDLASAVILTGGSSQWSVLEKRLSLELPRFISSAFKCKVVASKHSIERSCAAWIGGSILTSLGSFQQLWLSRAEYDEYGAALAVQRFP